MPLSPMQPKLRASLLYLGSALFLTTGVVTIADQPLPQGGRYHCSCNINNQQPGYKCQAGQYCNYATPCHSFFCVTTPKSPYLTCSC